MPNYKRKFNQIYNEHIGKIYRFVFLKVDSKETAEDLTSKVFSKFLDKLKQGTKFENVNAYLYQIARSEISNHYRKRAKYKIVSIETTQVIDEQAGQIEMGQQKAEDLVVMRQCIADLDDQEQNIVIWRYLDRFSFKKIAQMTGKKQGNVRVILHRALKELKQKMEKMG